MTAMHPWQLSSLADLRRRSEQGNLLRFRPANGAVDLERLDQLIRLAGQLSIGQSRLAEVGGRRDRRGAGPVAQFGGRAQVIDLIHGNIFA